MDAVLWSEVELEGAFGDSGDWLEVIVEWLFDKESRTNQVRKERI